MIDVDGFDLSVVSLAAGVEGSAMQAFEDLHCAMLDWYGVGLFPEVSAVQAALVAGFNTCGRVGYSMATLKQYASGIIKWAKAGKVPTVAKLSAVQASPPGTKSAKGRKKGAQTAPKTPEATKTPEGLTPLAQARAWINSIQATRMAFLGTADAEALSEALLQALAVLNRVKG